MNNNMDELNSAAKLSKKAAPPQVTVAQANKTARIVWALLAKQEDYRAPVAMAA